MKYTEIVSSACVPTLTLVSLLSDETGGWGIKRLK